MEFTVRDNIKKKIEEQGLKLPEIQEIVDASNKSSHKLCLKEDKSIYLAKSEFGSITVYVEYNKNEILNVYTHKMKITGLTGNVIEPVDCDDSTEWICCSCETPAIYRNIDMTYFGVVRPGPGIVCPKCHDSYVSEGVSKTIKKAEDTLEEKRG